ncbi:MAG: hypothetical protein F6K10_00840 [Moorea sp. SIO2B7]|nr:hypothetical protein [Moorena sp. SIO2B7]
MKSVLKQKGIDSPEILKQIITDTVQTQSNLVSNDLQVNNIDAAKAVNFAKLLIEAPGSKDALTQHLKQSEVKFYGFEVYGFEGGGCLCDNSIDTQLQKQYLGEEMFSKLTFINCKQDSQCRKKNIFSNTWEVNGKLYPGVKNLIQLARLSEYQGSHNFAEVFIDMAEALEKKAKFEEALEKKAKLEEAQMLYADAQKLDISLANNLSKKP